MDVYKTEEEQVEAIKKWWNENGKSIIVGIVVGITAIFGWRGYEARTATEAKAASILYEQLILASRKGDKENMREISDDIMAKTNGKGPLPYRIQNIINMRGGPEKLKEGNYKVPVVIARHQSLDSMIFC